MKNFLRPDIEQTYFKSVHIYKKLGIGKPLYENDYFESITEYQFNNTPEKHLISLNSLLKSEPRYLPTSGTMVKGNNRIC